MRPEPSSKAIIRDVTLREGLDVPGVEFSFTQRLEIAKALAGAGIPEIEIVAPGKVREDSGFAGICLENRDQVRCRTSGLVYSFRQQSIREMTRTGRTPREVMDAATWARWWPARSIAASSRSG